MEIRHNYDAVNAAIAQQQKNAYEELRRQQAARWSLYAGSTIKFCAAAAILVFAWWLISERGYDGVYGPVDTNTGSGGQGLVEIIHNVPTETSTGASINSDFVIFHTVENTDGSTVTTGWKYNPEDIENPHSKYCYWSKRSGFDSNKSERVDLGKIEADGNLSWSDVDAKYKKYFNDCEFGTPAISHTTGTTTQGSQVFEKTWRSIVYIESGDSQGSGVLVSTSLIATNCHVIKRGNVYVYPPHSHQATAKNGVHAAVVRRDNKRDFCLLRAPNIKGHVANIRKFNTLQIGETVYALGAPKGLELTLTSGLVSQLRRDSGKRTIQTNAAISPGSSGGGLFDSNGNLIGITTSSISGDDAQGLNFAIPADLVLRK